MERELQHWLQAIVEWSARLEGHISGLDEIQFAADTKTRDAAIRCIECIGEAAKRILARKDELGLDPQSLDFFEAHWTRNRLIHGYFDIDTNRVWLTATISVPRLADRVKSIIQERFGP
jgi:uncharacterized protein with HEPN domain